MGKERDMEEKVVRGKFLLLPHTQSGNLIVGGIFSNLLTNKNTLPKSNDELWVAELIITPHYIFTDNKDKDWVGLDISQKLASGWGNKDNWKKQILNGGDKMKQ
jgi:hypothetical protein